MKTVDGRRAEARLYLAYVLALFRPGTAVPVFHQPRKPTRSAASLPAVDRAIVIEEGRRQLDHQNADMQRNHTRAATLLTVTVAEVVFLARAASTAFDSAWPVLFAWAASAVLAALAAAGAVAVLTTSAVYGRVHTADIIDSPEPAEETAARLYADAVGFGESTNAARLTVLRDAVLLTLLAALLLAALTPFTVKNPAAVCRPDDKNACVVVVRTPTPSATATATVRP